MIDGCLVVYKPKGITSHDVINKIRRVYKQKKCGHAGTLDPMAQGVLLVFFGKALKLINFIPPVHLDKTYLARLSLGKTTDSYDATGNITSVFDGSTNYSSDILNKAINKFIGKYDQIPPVYSAIKVEGKKAYAMARAGENISLAGRPVDVTSIRVIKDYFEQDIHNLLIRVHCSRGTYIRSIAQDIGQELGCGAYLSYLLRERVGKWDFSQAFPYWKIEKGIPFENDSAFTKFSDVLSFPKITVKEETLFKINNGQGITRKDISKVETTNEESSELFQILSPDQELIAIYSSNKQTKEENKELRLFPMRVFHKDETD
ncbi:MAG: tRNA pseudouridine(55) synthase TruB [Candidatus Riflebacteria bacterium]|nr:tRNA pseudouridine(55) synthase TruB [Candidatus Riflebacteria bacterium]